MSQTNYTRMTLAEILNSDLNLSGNLVEVHASPVGVVIYPIKNIDNYDYAGFLRQVHVHFPVPYFMFFRLDTGREGVHVMEVAMIKAASESQLFITMQGILEGSISCYNLLVNGVEFNGYSSPSFVVQ